MSFGCLPAHYGDLYQPTGMTGNTGLDNAVLGGASDYITDISINMYKIWFAKDDEKVVIVCVVIVDWSCTYIN